MAINYKAHDHGVYIKTSAKDVYSCGSAGITYNDEVGFELNCPEHTAPRKANISDYTEKGRILVENSIFIKKCNNYTKSLRDYIKSTIGTTASKHSLDDIFKFTNKLENHLKLLKETVIKAIIDNNNYAYDSDESAKRGALQLLSHHALAVAIIRLSHLQYLKLIVRVDPATDNDTYVVKFHNIDMEDQLIADENAFKVMELFKYIKYLEKNVTDDFKTTLIYKN